MCVCRCYPGSDGGEQLEERCQTLQLSLSDASDGWMAILGEVCTGNIPSQVLMIHHEGMEQVLP